MISAHKIAIILPAYNEELTIRETIKGFHRNCPEAYIVVVNNNCDDNTASIAENTLQEIEAQGCVLSETRPGKGNAVRRAFTDIDANIYVLADADMTYPSEQVTQLITPIAAGQADMVVGDRLSGGQYQKENKRNFHNFGNILVRGLINKLFKAGLNDIMSGYRAFSRTFVKNYPILVEGFQIETDMTLHALDKRFRVLEIPIEYRDRPPGSESKLNTFADGTRVLHTIFQILRHYRPLTFFGALSAFFAAMGLFAGYPVINDWISHRYIYHVPLAIMASALGILATITLSLGLILDSITHQYRMKYERDMVVDRKPANTT